MDALFQFFATLVVAMAAMAFSHFGVETEGLGERRSAPKAERSIKRSPVTPPAPERTR